MASFDDDIGRLISDFEAFKKFGSGKAEAVLRREANRNLRLIKRLTPRSKFNRRHLRSGWKVKFKRDPRSRILSYEIVNDDPRARFLIPILEFGTQGPIVPRKAKVLSWVDHLGVRHFAKSVRGIRPHGMIRRTKAHMEGRIPALSRELAAAARKEFTTLRARS